MSIGLPDEFPFNRRQDTQSPVEAPPAAAPDESENLEVFSSFTSIQAPEPAAPAAVRTRPPSLGTERRSAARQTLVARATIKPESNYRGCGPLAAGYVSNISLKGIGFHTRRPLLVGESYQLKLEVGPLKWQSRLRVVTCNEHESGTYDIGAEFIANELQLPALRGLAA